MISINAGDSKIGVLLLNMGGPDSLEAVKPFLFNLFSDPYIANFGKFQKFFAFLIANFRAKKVKAAYKKIGGKSPLKEITLSQAKALQESLGENFKVRAAMRYWHPFLNTVINELKKEKIKKLIVIPLYPQFCTATTRSLIEEFKKLADKFFEYKIVESWSDFPPFVDAWIEKIQEAFSKFGNDCFILFSAHGIPESLLKKGDPYIEEVKKTVKAIVEKMKLNKNYKICYQSKVGPIKWVQPSTEKVMTELANREIKKVLIVPISFVSDHIETLYEIDIVFKEKAKNLGIELYRVASLNDSAKFINALKTLVLESI
ncbi:MAG: ferrochelatase [Thermodesulfovibrionaceae bacterium]